MVYCFHLTEWRDRTLGGIRCWRPMQPLARGALSMRERHWTQVRSTSSLVEAEMLRDLLHYEGISGLVQPSDASAYLGVMSPCKVLVRETDASRATAFLDAWEHGEQEQQEAVDIEDGADQ